MNHPGPHPLGRQLAATAKATRAEFDTRLGEAGGSLTTFIVLRLASEAPGGLELSQRQLADRMGVEAPTMVRHLDRLEREGLIERRRDARDRRVTRITVTPAGGLKPVAPPWLLSGTRSMKNSMSRGFTPNSCSSTPRPQIAAVC